MSANQLPFEHHFSGKKFIADPGNAGSIVADRSLSICNLVSAGAETRTLRRPTMQGDRITLHVQTYVGDITLTVTGGYNTDGDTTFTFSAAGQFLDLISFYDGTNYFWRKISDWSTANLTPTEAGWLDGVTPGTAAASKALVLDSSLGIATITTATITTLTTTSIVRTGYPYKIGAGAKAGTTAGWTVGAGNNLGTIATVAASQSACTLVVPVVNVHIGDTITGFRVVASINSAGGTVTLDADLRKLVVAAGATATDSSIGTLTQVSVATATASNTTKTGLTEVVAAGTRYYLLLTVTTAGSTTLELDDLEITVTTG